MPSETGAPHPLPTSPSPAWLLLGALAPMLSLLLAWYLSPDLRSHPRPDFATAFYPGREVSTTPTLVLEGPWQPGPGEARAAASEQCRASVRLPEGPWVRLHVVLNGTADQTWVLSVRRDFASVTLPTVQPGTETILDGRRLPPGTGPITLELSPRPPLTGQPLLARVWVRASPLSTDQLPPSLPAIAVAGLMPLSISLFLLVGRRRSLDERRALTIGTILGIGLLLLPPAAPGALELLWVIPTACFLGTAAAAGWRSLPASGQPADQQAILRRVAEGAAIAAILCLALQFRWHQLLNDHNLPLLDDARGYLMIAREGSFYETAQPHGPWIREPLFPALVRLWITLAPDTELSARFGVSLAGLLTVGAIWLTGRALFSPVVGLLAALAAAALPYFTTISVSLLRDDVLVSLFLGLMAVPLLAGERRWWRAVLFGVLGGALGLTRINGLVLLGPLVLLEATRRRWHPGEVLLVFLIAVPPILPHLAFAHRLSGGDWLYSNNVHTRYYMNRDMVGVAGYPATLAEWHREPYAGPVASTAQMLANHGPLEWARRLVRGFVMIFLWEFPHEKLFRGQEWLMIPLLFGAWVALQRWRELWWVGVWFGLFLAPLALVATIHLDRRLALPAAPLILWLWAAGVEEIFRLIRSRLRSPKA